MNNGNDVNQRDAENFEASDNESAQQNQFRNDSFTFDDDLNDDGDNTEYPEWHASSQNDNQAAGEETHFENADTQENRQAEQPAEASSAQSNADSNNRQNRFSANNLKNFLKFLVVLVVVGGGIMLATSKGDKGKTGKTGTAESEEEHEIKIGDAESAASSVANIPAFVSAPAAPASDMLPPIVVGGSEPTAAVVPQTQWQYLHQPCRLLLFLLRVASLLPICRQLKRIRRTAKFPSLSRCHPMFNRTKPRFHPKSLLYSIKTGNRNGICSLLPTV